jgi:hypothetical protein
MNIGVIYYISYTRNLARLKTGKNLNNTGKIKFNSRLSFLSGINKTKIEKNKYLQPKSKIKGGKSRRYFKLQLIHTK